MPILLQLAQSYSNPDSVNYKLAYLREQIEQQLLNLGDLAYEDQVQLAMLGETIIVGGYLRTELIAANSIVTRHIQAGAITADKIDSNAIAAQHIQAGAITADKIDSNAIAAQHIQAGAITADKIDVQTLSAISANLGTITGGSLNIGNGAFKVSSAGKLEATGADISGKITATSGTIGGWNITRNYIDTRDGSARMYLASHADSAPYYIYASNSSGSTMFSVSKTGVLYARNADISGKITANSGSISNWTLGTNIYAKKGDTYTTLKSGGDVAFAAGSSSPNDTTGAALQIFHDGRIRANKDGVRRVELNYDSLSFFDSNGVKRGEIAGVTGSADSWPGVNIRTQSDTIRLEACDRPTYQAAITLLGENEDDEPSMITLRTGSHAKVSYLQIDSFGTTLVSDSFYFGIHEVMHRGLIQAGNVNVTPVANTPTSVRVYFPTPFKKAPRVVATAWSGAPGTSVHEVSMSNPTATYVDLYIYRNNTTNTDIAWIAMEPE